MWCCLPVRLSSCEGAIRSVRSVFCWKINFHGWVAGGWVGGGGWRLAGSTENKANLSHGLFWAGARARAELGNISNNRLSSFCVFINECFVRILAESCNFFCHHPLLGTAHHPILQNKTAPKINTKLPHYDGLAYFTTIFFNTELISLPNFQFHHQYCFIKLQLAISLEIELS